MSLLKKICIPIIACALLIPVMPAFTADDAHFIQDDDYFIAQEQFKQGWIRVFLAKMKTPATPQTKNEAEFIQVSDGNEVWTKLFYKTTIAAETDIKIGTLIISLDVADDKDIYIAPATKDEAHNSPWFMAKITDVSDLYKGYVTVSGGYKVSKNNLRIIVK